MGANLAELMLQIKPDPWRVNAKFSPELDAVNEVLWRGIDDSTAIEEISSWLHHHQPCLFGRIAAKACQLAFCFIRESDISKGDAYVRDKIQNARLEWTREAFYGRSSGFIIMILSRGVAQALPNDTIKNLAIRLCSLYLLEDIEVDRVFVDRLWLEVPGPAKRTWEWKVGVNYFSSQGDQRWWHDHRIPGGMAFSMNSVGHFVKSGLLAKGMRGLEQSLNFDSAMWEASKIDSLQRALELAMRSIDGAAETESGRATELLDLPLSDQILTDSSSFIRLPKDLTSKNHHNYLGHYHTDHIAFIVLPAKTWHVRKTLKSMSLTLLICFTARSTIQTTKLWELGGPFGAMENPWKSKKSVPHSISFHQNYAF
ncbi:MAG: hypothetical protein IPK83_19655 [Planctomycetes bacterium]|nr:hypothetical protein [Planctomycetota bacterium]